MKFISVEGYSIDISKVTHYWGYINKSFGQIQTGVRFEFPDKFVDVIDAKKETVDELVNATSDFSKEKVESLQAQVKDLISSEVTADAEIERLRDVINTLEESRGRVQDANRTQLEQITTLYEALAHGDEDHKKWLKDTITTHFRLMGVSNGDN